MTTQRTTVVARVAFLFVTVLETAPSLADPPEAAPLPNAHAHNDYLHARPLFDALDHGFTSVEVDVFPVDNNLLVGHDRDTLKPDRTLETLYLAPLAERARQNNGHIYPNGGRFFLLIDIKDDPQKTYRLLQPLLAKYGTALTAIENGKLPQDAVRPGAVTIVLTGPRLPTDLVDSNPRYAAVDGRLSKLDSLAPSHLMPMISDDWTKHFTWKGTGPMPESERTKLKEIVRKAHARGRVVRFWKTPENESTWRELRSAGVDLINTDELARLAKFLQAPGR